jgi:predicted Mrr-cat superfamily restriction endonuclease
MDYVGKGLIYNSEDCEIVEYVGATAKDFIGGEIQVGDTVVFMQTKYRNLMIGTVKSLSPKTLTISHEKTNIGDTETRQFHSQVVVVTGIVT